METENLIEDAGLVSSAAIVINTMLCVNAPNMLQLAVAQLQGITVDVSIYKRRRDKLSKVLADAVSQKPNA